MLDIKFIRQNVQLVREALSARGDDFDLNQFLELDEKRRSSIKEIDDLRQKQNKANEEIKALLGNKKDISGKVSEMKKVSEEISGLKIQFKEIEEKFEGELLNIPNISHSSTPQGNASCNKIVKTWGKPKEFSFKPLSHVEIAERLGIIDFKAAAKICGSNFALFKSDGAKLERALVNFMLDLHTKEHSYKEVLPPFLVNRTSMVTTGQLPRLEEDMYRLKEEDYFLIPTAEVPITNIHRDDTFNEKELPICYVSNTACFRREAGSYGKETKGLSRVHQFNKVELVKFVAQEDSYQELEKLVANACRVIELLEIPYRLVLLASGDLSFAAAKCYDIEIYAPGADKTPPSKVSGGSTCARKGIPMDKWLEVSSCSNFEDFQARRGNIRYREKETGKMRFVHTLNGSGVALARLVISILENYQQDDGSVIIPQVLRRYMDGRERITK